MEIKDYSVIIHFSIIQHKGTDCLQIFIVSHTTTFPLLTDTPLPQFKSTLSDAQVTNKYKLINTTKSVQHLTKHIHYGGALFISTTNVHLQTSMEYRGVHYQQNCIRTPSVQHEQNFHGWRLNSNQPFH